MSVAVRRSHIVTAVIANGAALSGAISMKDFAAGLVEVPATITAAGLGFHVCSTVGGTFIPLYDHDLTLVEISAMTASRAYELPPEVFAARYIKLWSQTGGSGVNQGGARTFVVHLKS